MGNLPVTGINHICIVTGDLDLAMRRWHEKYGIGPWRYFRYGDANMSATVAGEPASFGFRAGLAQLGESARVEIIQPLDSDSPYAESLRAHGGADHIHHVRLDVSDYATAVAAVEDAGVPKSLSADFQSGGEDDLAFNATYFDTQGDLGFTLELGQAPSGFTMPNPEGIHPPLEEA
jgi:hypothetical protein